MIVRLPVEDARQQNARWSHDGTSRFEQQMQLESAQRAKRSLRVRCNLFLKILLRSLVRNSKAAAGVDVANIVTLFAQHANQIRHAFERLLEGADIGDLRSDVDT